MYKKIIKEIYSYKNNQRAKSSAWFFKTGKGQYGEGDIFIGINVPDCRLIVKKYHNISLSDIKKLLKDKVHEIRLIALLVLVQKYQKGDTKIKKEIVDFYLENIKYINNWDLVDLSAPYILSDYLKDKKDKSILLKLAKSGKLWEERISVLGTAFFIKNNNYEWTLKLAQGFLSHRHDLIHKAVGWMLREVGKKDEKVLRKFLDKNIRKMPRTMLRYSIERFPNKLRLEYLEK